MNTKKTMHISDHAGAGEALREFYVRSNRKLEHLLAAKGASFARIKMLSYIERHPSVRSIDLMEAFSHAPRTITEALDLLERDGLAERQPDPRDRRAKIIVLTDAGKVLLREVEPTLCKFGEDLFITLNKQEMDQLAGLLSRLNTRLDEI